MQRAPIRPEPHTSRSRTSSCTRLPLLLPAIPKASSGHAAPALPTQVTLDCHPRAPPPQRPGPAALLGKPQILVLLSWPFTPTPKNIDSEEKSQHALKVRGEAAQIMQGELANAQLLSDAITSVQAYPFVISTSQSEIITLRHHCFDLAMATLRFENRAVPGVWRMYLNLNYLSSMNS